MILSYIKILTIRSKNMSSSIYPINNPPYKLPFVVLGIGFEDNQAHILRKEGYSVHQMLFCKSGEGTLIVNQKTYKILKNTFFYLEPNTPHEYYGNTDIWEVEWITFSGNHIEDTLNELEFDCSKIGVLSNFNTIQSLFNKIYVTLKAEEHFGKLISSNMLFELLVECYIMSHNESKNAPPKGAYLAESVKNYIDEHYDEDITINELSELVNVTPQHLCRIFKRHLNLRPFEYLAMKRIKEAKTLLSNTKMTVYDIGLKVGYHDCSYFCAMFKRYELISPSEFRGLNF
jgi:AraC family transcriptional regulator of arabinose operon